MKMLLSRSQAGWTAVDGSDGRSMCGVSVRAPASRALQKPQVVAVAEAGCDAVAADQATALRDVLSHTDRSLPALVTLRRADYRLRVMPEPAVTGREMLSSLRWSLDADLDGEPGDLNLAWMRIPTEEQLPSRPRQLYAVTTSKTAMTARVAAWREAGLRPQVVDIRETSLRNLSGALERPGEGLALIAADRDGVGMVFTHGGSLYLDRFIEQPFDEIAAADAPARERLHERIATQLMRSLDVIGRSFPFMPITRVIVAPSPSADGLFDYLSAQLPVAVEALDLGMVFDLSRVPALAESSALQSRCLVPLGAALRTGWGGTA